MNLATAHPADLLVAGVDRCKGGWVIALSEGADSPRPPVLFARSDTSQILELTHDAAVVAIDMPLALAIDGRRSAEGELRSVLGAKARSVFTSPTRSALACDSQAQATIENRARGGPGISAQSWGLAGPIRECRQALRDHPALPRWFETHPERSFMVLNGLDPVASKKTAVGVAVRLRLLRSIWPEVDEAVEAGPGNVPIDDALDALVAAWSARRIADRACEIFGPPERDDEGFPLAIRI